MAKIQFPLQFERQYSNPIDIDMVFETTTILNSYLTDDKRYAGMIVTCKEQEGKIFVLNNAKDEWLTFDSSLYEKVANKVTTFNNPTDTQYPSAKLVKDYVDTKASTVYKPQGSLAFNDLVVGLLVEANSGFVYNITEAFITNENFVEGAGKSHSAGTNVVIIEHSGNYKFDVLGGTVDLTPYELLSNKVIAWSETTNNTRYASEKLVKDSLDAVTVGLENIGSLSPLRFAGYFTGGTVSNDFNNLIRPFENLTNPLPDFYLNNVQGAMFVCSAASDFVFNTVYFWSDEEGTGKTTPITFNWAAPYDEGIGTTNFEVGDTISILKFAYDTVENEMFILIKVEKNLEENFVVKNESITPATKAKITYDAKGLVTAGADLIADDIPDLPQSKITDLVTDLGNKADKRPAQKTITTATTLALTDEGKVILANGALKVTIPLNSSVSFPIDTEIAIVRYGTGEVTIGTASGATLNGESSTTTFTLGDQYSSVALKKISTNAWIIIGNFT